MKLYICWNTVQVPRPPRGHPCHNAYKALRDAGHDPGRIKVHGLGFGPIKLLTGGRRTVQELTGSPVVPVLVTYQGEPINGPRESSSGSKAIQQPPRRMRASPSL